jgi:hypothetical protein
MVSHPVRNIDPQPAVSAAARKFEMALTKEEVQTTNRSRDNNWKDCISAAKAGGYSVPSGQLAAVITWPDVDMWGSSGKGAHAQGRDQGS